MSDTPKGLDIPWVKEQVKKGLEMSQETTDIRVKLDTLGKDTLVSFITNHKNAEFKKNESPENGAAHIVVYQKALKLLDPSLQLEVDGIYGPATKEALKTFQSSIKGGVAIVDDGIPGPNTADKLIAALGASVAKPVQAVETPVQKVEKAKTALSAELIKLGVTLLYDPPEQNGIVFTKGFTLGERTFYIGISKDGAQYSAFEIKNKNHFGLKNGKWEGRSADGKGGNSDLHDLATVIKALPKLKESTEGLEKYRGKIEMKGVPALIPEIHNDPPKIYFKVEGGGQGGYIRLEKADIDTPRAVTHNNIKVEGKEYTSITLTPQKDTHRKLTITVTSVEKSTVDPLEKVGKLTLTPAQSATRTALTTGILRVIEAKQWEEDRNNIGNIIHAGVTINNKVSIIGIDTKGLMYGFVEYQPILDNLGTLGSKGEKANKLSKDDFLAAIQQITKAPTTRPALTPDTHPKKDAILKSINRIPGLENATLAGLGFTIKGQEIVLPPGLTWMDTNKNAVKLEPGYEVKVGRIQKKPPVQTDARGA